jgi:hypothetical protein
MLENKVEELKEKKNIELSIKSPSESKLEKTHRINTTVDLNI